MPHVTNSKNFAHWTQNPTGNGTVSVLEDSRLRLQNPDATSRALVFRNVMLMPGDVITMYAVGKTTSLTAGELLMGIDYPIGTRKAVTQFNHNDGTQLRICQWKVPVEWTPTSARVWCGLSMGTVAIAYLTDLWFEIESHNLMSRRILMDGVIDITAGVTSLSSIYDSTNVGTITASSINIDIAPASFAAGNRRPLAYISPMHNTSEDYTKGVLVPVCNFTAGNVLNVRLLNPTTGATVGVTGATINKTFAFRVMI